MINLAFSDQLRYKPIREIIIRAGYGDNTINVKFLYHNGIHLIQLKFKNKTIFVTKEQLTKITKIQLNTVKVWISPEGNGRLYFQYGDLPDGFKSRNSVIFIIKKNQLDSYRLTIEQKHGEPIYISKKLVQDEEKNKTSHLNKEHDAIVYKQILYKKDGHTLNYKSNILFILENQTWGDLTKFFTSGSIIKVNPRNFLILNGDSTVPLLNMSSTDGLNAAKTLEETKLKRNYKYIEISKATDKIEFKNSINKGDKVLIFVDNNVNAKKVASFLNQLYKIKAEYLTIDGKLKIKK